MPRRGRRYFRCTGVADYGHARQAIWLDSGSCRGFRSKGTHLHAGNRTFRQESTSQEGRRQGSREEGSREEGSREEGSREELPRRRLPRRRPL